LVGRISEKAIAELDFLEAALLYACDYGPGWDCYMSFLKHTLGISRADLTRDCLLQIRLWPGCETVEGLGVLGDLQGGFSLHVIKYGVTKKKIADRAVRSIQREKLRWHHLRLE
jgi:hypothetical protein